MKLKLSIFCILLSVGYASIVAQVSGQWSVITKSYLSIDKFDLYSLSGTFKSGQNGLLFSTEIIPKKNRIKTVIKNLKNIELAYVETVLKRDSTSKPVVVIRYFNKQIVYASATQTFQRKQSLESLKGDELEKIIGDNISKFTEVYMIPQLAIALGQLGIPGKFLPNAQQLYRVGLGFSRYFYLRQSFAAKTDTAYDKFRTNKAVFAKVRSAPHGAQGNATTIDILPSPGVLPTTTTVAKTTSIRVLLEDPGNQCRCPFPTNGISGKEASKIQDLCRNMEEHCVPEGSDAGCKEYPNRDDSCFGMCGPGCSCWPSICGDCCYHDFCAEHDALCSKYTAYVSCVLVVPFGSTCNSPGLVSIFF